NLRPAKASCNGPQDPSFQARNAQPCATLVKRCSGERTVNVSGARSASPVSPGLSECWLSPGEYRFATIRPTWSHPAHNMAVAIGWPVLVALAGLALTARRDVS